MKKKVSYRITYDGFLESGKCDILSARSEASALRKFKRKHRYDLIKPKNISIEEISNSEYLEGRPMIKYGGLYTIPKYTAALNNSKCAMETNSLKICTGVNNSKRASATITKTKLETEAIDLASIDF